MGVCGGFSARVQVMSVYAPEDTLGHFDCAGLHTDEYLLTQYFFFFSNELQKPSIEPSTVYCYRTSSLPRTLAFTLQKKTRIAPGNDDNMMNVNAIQ